MRTLPANCLPVGCLHLLLECLCLEELHHQLERADALYRRYMEVGPAHPWAILHMADLRTVARKAGDIRYKGCFTNQDRLTAARLTSYTLTAIAEGRRIEGLTSWLELRSLYRKRVPRPDRGRRARTSTDYL